MHPTQTTGCCSVSPGATTMYKSVFQSSNHKHRARSSVRFNSLKTLTKGGGGGGFEERRGTGGGRGGRRMGEVVHKLEHAFTA